MTTVTGPSGCQTGYAYNSSGQMTGITDPNGYATTYAYNSSGFVSQRTVAGVGTSSYIYTFPLMAYIDPLNAITTYAVSAGYLPSLKTDAVGNLTSFLRAANGLMIARIAYRTSLAVPAVSGVTQLTFTIGGTHDAILKTAPGGSIPNAWKWLSSQRLIT